MAINVAGTNALGDYLVSKIVNTRTLFGLPPQPSSALVAGKSSGTAPTPAAPAIPVAPTRSELQAQVLAQQVANTQTLFGIAAAADRPAGALPPIAGQTSQQLAFAAIQSSQIAADFSNTAVLFGSLGLGSKADSRA